jgi:hypothetical protein
MKIPEKFEESLRSQKFRETQPMCVAYKLINLDNPRWRDRGVGVVIDVRVFWSNNSQTCRAVVWIADEKGSRYGYGVGRTSGGGYHHESAAIMDAFQDMGITFGLGEGFSGKGIGAQEAAIKSVGKALGYENTYLVYFNP